MDYLYAARVNEQIRSGNLPHYALKKDLNVPAITLDFQTRCKDVFTVINEISPYFGTLLRLFVNMLPELEALCKPLNFEYDINFLINTELNPKCININSSAAKKACELYPCISVVDKAIRILIDGYGKMLPLVAEDSKEETTAIFFTWVYLLRVVQNKERASGKTLNLSVIDDDTILFKLLSSPWDETNENFLIDLLAEEKQALEDLFIAREDLKNNIKKEYVLTAAVAKETDEAWDLFLELLNDLSSHEYLAVEQVCANISTEEKLCSIRKYIALFNNIKSGYYIVNGVSHELSSLIATIKRRMEIAPAHCNVKESPDHSFRLCGEAIDLLSYPLTFNYLLLTYHQFRLHYSKENALFFSNLALNCLNRNFLIDDDANYTSIEVIVEKFVKSFLSRASNCQSAIQELSFDSIQQDAVTIGTSAVYSYAFSQYNNHLSTKLISTELDIDKKGIDAYLKEIQSTQYTKEQIEAAAFEDNRAFKQSISATAAHQIVVSLNIAYLLCDALKIMQSFNHEYMYFTDKNLIDQYISDLEWEIDQISCVYTKEANVKRFREDKGIDTKLLSVRERAEAKIRNDALMQDILSVLEEFSQKINLLDIDGLITFNASIRSKIRKHTICDLSEDFIEKFIAISEQICNRLITLSKSTILDYDLMRQTLISNLGIQTRFLPPSVIDSLTTAELLYKQYASLKYAEKNFDYSSISALYYQAFEDAYNQLIWYHYAVKLNTLTFGPHSYPEILFENQGKQIKNPDAIGYLSQDPRTRNGYLDFNRSSKRAYVQTSCMYKRFVTIMEQIKPDSDIKKFCNHFAKLAGYRNSYAMLCDSDFMEKVSGFTKAIDRSVFNRNNASHGGLPVPLDQCQKDKQTVLSEIKNVRENSIGLIQQLLYLLKDSKTLTTYNH